MTSRHDGPSGLRAGLDLDHDFVLCDIGLPGISGFQVVSALRGALAAPQPCFIATTGYSAAAEMAMATEAGFDHYLVKPVSMDAISAIIRTHAAHLRVPARPRGDAPAAAWSSKS